jgi:hypothetical protein
MAGSSPCAFQCMGWFNHWLPEYLPRDAPAVSAGKLRFFICAAWLRDGPAAARAGRARRPVRRRMRPLSAVRRRAGRSPATGAFRRWGRECRRWGGGPASPPAWPGVSPMASARPRPGVAGRTREPGQSCLPRALAARRLRPGPASRGATGASRSRRPRSRTAPPVERRGAYSASTSTTPSRRKAHACHPGARPRDPGAARQRSQAIVLFVHHRTSGWVMMPPAMWITRGGRVQEIDATRAHPARMYDYLLGRCFR